MKQTEIEPVGRWSSRSTRSDTKVKGKVRNLTNYGAFVEIEEGIDGLLHVSRHVLDEEGRHPSEVVKKGDAVERSCCPSTRRRSASRSA